MQSRPLRQTIDLTLDTMGMRGPVQTRAVAEAVMRAAPEDYWSVGDERDAKIAYLQDAIRTRMREALSPEYIAEHLGYVPEKYRKALRDIPRFICISPRGGTHAEHVMAINAASEDWDANAKLKTAIFEATRLSRNRARTIRDLLKASGARSLVDLLATAEAAE